MKPPYFFASKWFSSSSFLSPGAMLPSSERSSFASCRSSLQVSQALAEGSFPSHSSVHAWKTDAVYWERFDSNKRLTATLSELYWFLKDHEWASLCEWLGRTALHEQLIWHLSVLKVFIPLSGGDGSLRSKRQNTGQDGSWVLCVTAAPMFLSHMKPHVQFLHLPHAQVCSYEIFCIYYW